MIAKMHSDISRLSRLDKKDEIMKFISKNYFSLIFRIAAIDIIRIRSSMKTPGSDGLIINGANDYNMCIKLLSLTHPKNVNFDLNMEVSYVEMSEKEIGKFRVLGISNIIDRILQLQMLIFLDPLVDANLMEHFYGFRKGRNALQAIGFLSRSIQLSDTNRFVLLSIDIEKCFDNISHQFIYMHFPFPNRSLFGLLKR